MVEYFGSAITAMLVTMIIITLGFVTAYYLSHMQHINALRDDYPQTTLPLNVDNVAKTDEGSAGVTEKDLEDALSKVDLVTDMEQSIAERLDDANRAKLLEEARQQANHERIVEFTQKLIVEQEGDYSTIIRDDNGGLSIGKAQWHNERAGGLLLDLYREDPSLFRDSDELINKLSGDASDSVIENRFIGYVPSIYVTSVIRDAITSDMGKEYQDKLMKSDTEHYFEVVNSRIGENADEYVKIFIIDIMHQYGVDRGLNFTLNRARINASDTLEDAYDKWSNLTDEYNARRDVVFKEIQRFRKIGHAL